MSAGSAPARITIRQSRLPDAAAINELVIERKVDSAPGYEEYNAIRARWHAEHGLEKYRRRISAAHDDPEQYFSCVAVDVDHGQVVGFANADAATCAAHCQWRGLFVSRAYERRGVGTRLEDARLTWARALECTWRRPIMAGWRSSGTGGFATSERAARRPSYRFHSTCCASSRWPPVDPSAAELADLRLPRGSSRREARSRRSTWPSLGLAR